MDKEANISLLYFLISNADIPKRTTDIEHCHCESCESTV